MVRSAQWSGVRMSFGVKRSPPAVGPGRRTPVYQEVAGAADPVFAGESVAVLTGTRPSDSAQLLVAPAPPGPSATVVERVRPAASVTTTKPCLSAPPSRAGSGLVWCGRRLVFAVGFLVGYPQAAAMAVACCQEVAASLGVVRGAEAAGHEQGHRSIGRRLGADGAAFVVACRMATAHQVGEEAPDGPGLAGPRSRACRHCA